MTNTKNTIDVQIQKRLDNLIDEWCTSLDRRNFHLRLPNSSDLVSQDKKQWGIDIIDKRGWVARYAKMVFDSTGIKLPSSFVSNLRRVIISDS